jgi:hypothetical protein
MGVYFIFLASILLHGLVIWQDPVQRTAAFVVSAIIVLMTVIVIWRGGFTRRNVVEIRLDHNADKHTFFSLVGTGQPLVAEITLHYGDRTEQIHADKGEIPHFDLLEAITLHLPQTNARELKVWVHQVTEVLETEVLPAQFELQYNDEVETVMTQSASGGVMLPLRPQPSHLYIKFPKANTWQTSLD